MKRQDVYKQMAIYLRKVQNLSLKVLKMSNYNDNFCIIEAFHIVIYF